MAHSSGLVAAARPKACRFAARNASRPWTRASKHGELEAAAARLQLRGAPVRLTPRAALTLGMAFHELGTNAAKYGALSTSAGRIEVSWQIAPEDEGTWLRLEWRETGGPRVDPPQRVGFGLRLIERSLEHDLDGTARLDFDPDGLRCALAIPLAGPAGDP